MPKGPSTRRRNIDKDPSFTRSESHAQSFRMEAVRPLNDIQKQYLTALKSGDIVFGVGPAGTGKTYLATRFAATALHNGEIKKILITRPAVEAGEKLGFLPGELNEKFEPYLAPIKEVLREVFTEGTLTSLIRTGRIEAVPVGYLRGRSLKDTYVLLDEAQNLTPTQMKMVLTRLGEGSKLIIDGDPSQKDIPGPSGLTDAVRRMEGSPYVRVVKFTKEDCVRSGVVMDVLNRYES